MFKTCLHCNEEFDAERPDKSFCSRSCYKKYNYVKNNPLFKVPCKGCGKLFLPLTHRMIFCSDECRKGYFNVKSKDDVRFGGNKEKALMRDGYACVVCKNTKDIGVHHVDESGSSDKPNNEISNLITLCRSCHIKHHKPHRKKIRCDITATCKHCGTKFQTTTERLIENRGKFCSKECQYAAMSKRQMSGITAICQICGKKFPTTPYKLSLGKSKYCGSECKRQAQIGVSKPKPSPKKILANCMLCGKEFPTTQVRLDDGRGKYCSKQCMYKAMSILKTKNKS